MIIRMTILFFSIFVPLIIKAQIADSLKEVEYKGYCIEIYFRIPHSNQKIKEGEYFVMNKEFNVNKLSLSTLYKIDRGRDSLILIASGEPFVTMNKTYFEGKLKTVIYDTTTVNMSKYVRLKKTKKYLYRYFPVVAKCSILDMPKSKLIHFISYNQYHFKSKETKVILVNELLVE